MKSDDPRGTRYVTPPARLPVTLAGLLCIAFSAAPASVLAEDDDEEETRRIVAEVIVFARTEGAGREEENPEASAGRPDIEGSLDPADEDSDLDWESELEKLDDTLEKLEDADDYRILTWGRWHQDERERDEAPKIRLSKEDEDLDAPDSGVYADPQHADMLDPDELLAPPETPLRRPLDGTIQVYRSRFFHARTDLLYHPDEERLEELIEESEETETLGRTLSAMPGEMLTSPDFRGTVLEPEDAGFTGFRLTNQRRLRLDEIHYLDHPVIGVILHVDRPED